MVSQEDLSQQEIEHEQRQSCEHEMQTHTPVPNRRALAQQERRRRERLKNIANQGSTSHQEIEPGQSERANQTHTPQAYKILSQESNEVTPGTDLS
ncbi:235_t:CDS:2, partial [Gigaspora rosea]